MTRPGLILFAFAATFAAAFTAPVAAADGAVEPVTVKAVAHFNFDRSIVLPADQARLLADVAQLKDVSWQAVTTTGYTDSMGSEAYNEQLSARRAAAVKAWLVSQGLAPEMIRAEGKGEQSPVADNASAEGRARNRRTEIEFSGVRATR